MTINERIEYLINVLFSGNKRAFSKAIDVSPTVTDNIVGKRQSSPSFEVTHKIISSIDNISIEWLMTGIGEPIRSNSDNEVVEKDKSLVDHLKNEIEEYKRKIDHLNNQIRILDKENGRLGGLLEKNNIDYKQTS